MSAETVVRRVLDALDAEGMAYAIVGSFASNIYGVPRATQDADIVVEAGPGQIGQVVKRLGLDFEREPQLQFETVTGTTKTVLRHRPSDFTIEVFNLSDDPHDQSRFARRRLLQIYGGHAWVLTPEDVLVTKLNWLHRSNRKKDLADIQNVMLVQFNALDWHYVETWCDQHGSRPLMERVRAEVSTALRGGETSA